jgi:hypothetical protein
MKLKNILLSLFIFIVCGELMVRLDQAVTPFAADNEVKVAMKIEESPEWKMAKSNSVPQDDTTLRIMILGDSYIHGAGIMDADKFSYLLRQDILKKHANGKYKRCFVLDLSRPANNNLDNYNTYHHFNKIFNPQVTILAYNVNDVLNNLDDQIDTVGAATTTLPVKQKEKPSLTKRLYDILYVSHAVQFSMHNLNDYLKSKGIIFPNSVFDQNLKSYKLNQPNWVKSKVILSKLIHEASSEHQKLIVLLMPEYDQLSHRSIFKDTDTIIQNFFKSQEPLTFINPVDYYKSYDPAQLRLNKYDGHPNNKAHRILANGVISVITDTLLKDISVSR